MKKFLAIIPAYNEDQSLAACVRALNSSEPELDILIINDGSTDCTEQVSKMLASENDKINYINHPINCGIGATIQTGLIYAFRNGYECAVQYDGDGQHDPRFVRSLYNHAKEHNLDLCIGSRFIEDPLTGRSPFKSTPLRRIGIRFFTGLISILCGLRITDPTSGFRVYRKRALQMFSLVYPDDYPEPEAVFWCARRGMRVGEIPVCMHARQGGRTSIRYLRGAYYMIKVTMSILIERLRIEKGVGNDG